MSKESLERAYEDGRARRAMVPMLAPRSGNRVMIPRGLVPDLKREGWKETE